MMTDLELLKKAARISDLGCNEWAYEKWEELNRAHFDNRLKVGAIHWGLTPHGHALGFYNATSNQITLHLSLMSPKGDAWGMSHLLGEKFALDVLLHEMIHQSNRQQGYDGKDAHNCEPWCQEINRIAPALGLKPNAAPIRQRRIKEPGQTEGNGKVTWVVQPGMMTRKELASWPHSVRPDGYYEKEAERLLATVTNN